MTRETSQHIPKKKREAVKEFKNLMEKKRTILVASIKGIPASQYQEIVKKFRGDAVVRVFKKNQIFRAINSMENEEVKNLKNYLKDNFAVMFSDIETFELSEKLLRKKISARAKAGQIAPQDIEVPAGPTDLVPGSAISELGVLGIQIQIEKGKISIKESKVIVKKGEKISQAAVDVMNKLDIKPFSIGFVPLASFDTQEKKIYVNIKINKEETLENIKTAFKKSLEFAVQINYPSKETIKIMLGKARRCGNALEKISKKINSERDN